MKTSQVKKTDGRIELESVARGLGVKGCLPKSDDTLKTKIAEAQITEGSPVEVQAEAVVVEVPVVTKRKPAPRMNVSGIYKDDRTAIIAKLEGEDPESKYIMQSGTITDRELAAKGFERTEFTVKNDIVCRTNKESYEEHRKMKNEAQYEAMQRIDGGTGIVGNHESQAKVPPTS
jgi:hypothetical protein